MTLAKLENNRFLWAENLERLGEMTPEDMSLTELKYKKNIPKSAKSLFGTS